MQMNTHLPTGSVPLGARQPPVKTPHQPSLGVRGFSEGSPKDPCGLRPTNKELNSHGCEDRGQDPTGAADAVQYLGAVLPREDEDVPGGVDGDAGEGDESSEEIRQQEGAEVSENGGEGSEDEDSRTFLGVFFQSGRLGVTIYEEVEARLSLLQVPEMPDFESLKLILFQVKPSIVVTNARPDRYFEDVLKNPPEELGAYELAFAPSKDFKFETAKSRLMHLELDIFRTKGNGGGPVNETERALLLRSLVDFDWKEAICAAGGLLQHLESNKMVDELQDSFVLAVTQIKTMQLDNFVHVDAQTLHSLQILHQDRHPSLFSKGKDKEGLSLFSLLDNTKSPVGRRLLKTWFLRPLMQEDDIRARFQAVRCEIARILRGVSQSLSRRAVAPGSAIRVSKGPFCHRCSETHVSDGLRNRHVQLKDIPRIMLRIRQSVASVADWQSLEQSLKVLASIRAACEGGLGPSVPSIIEDIKTRFSSHLTNLVALLNGVIDFEESRSRKRIVILEGVDDALDEEKRNYDKLGTFLEDVAMQEVEELPEGYDMRISVVFFPQLGYLVVAPRGQDAPPGMTMHFNTDEWIYYKTDRMRQLDEEVGDIYGRICDQEWAIMHEVREKLLEYHSTLLESCSIAARLDCILGEAAGFAAAAVERDYCEPRLVEESVCYIAEGRHPLCELCVDMYVPNNTCMDPNREGKSILSIVTGPNYSGKSVYLKQVALITFMAHLGSWVPAKSCEVGLVDRIFSRVQSRESCAVPVSSFAIDLNQVAEMLRSSTRRSLLLVDEFGKGTQSSDGIALLAATIRQLLSQENQCPRTVIATHFSELFTIGGILPASPYLGFNTMSVMGHDARSHRDLQSTPMPEPSAMELVYLYRLVDGKSCTSYGYQCAEQAGLPCEIVERAKLVSKQLRNNEPIERLEPEQEVSFRQHADELVALLRRFDIEDGDLDEFLQRITAGEAPGSATSTVRA